PVIWDELIAWFAGLRDEVDELYIDGSLWRLPETTLGRWGLGCRVTSLPSYSVDLCGLAASDGQLYPVLSANARQQLRRAFRYFERFGSLRLQKAATVAEAHAFFGALKELHSISWQQRGKAHSFTCPLFEPFHHLLIERSL